MATIIEFRPTANLSVRKTTSSDRSKSEASADIIIFPGVRIERQKNLPNAAAPASVSMRLSNHNID